MYGIELSRAIAPDIRPVRFAIAGLQHRDRCLIGMQHQTLEQYRPQRIDQWLQAHAASTDPLRERRAWYGNTGPFEDAFLPIKWLVIGVLCYKYLGQQSCCRQPL